MTDWYAPIARNVIAPLYAVRDHAPDPNILRELRKSEYLPPADLEARQMQRLQAIVRHAAATSPFYRQRFEQCGLNPRDFALQDFRRIPLLTKADVRTHGTEIMAQGFPREQLLPKKTGGSTSVPLEFYIDLESNARKNSCAHERNAWAGWLPGDKTALIWGATDLHADWRVRIRNLLLSRAIALDTLCLEPGMLHDYAREMVRFRPKVMFGHSHSMYMLALFLEKHGYAVPSIKTIVSTSTVLTETERKAMENFFQCRVFDRYGCEEVSLIASECERHEGLHLNVDHLYIEFVANGVPVEENICGDIVVTDLTNRGMPLIRYRVEDAGTPTMRTCNCGRTLPLMEKVQGRVADFIVTPEGRLLFGVSILDNFTAKHMAIERVQIIQDRIDHLQFRIVRAEDRKSVV